MILTTDETTDKRASFLEFLFGNVEGYVFLSFLSGKSREFSEQAYPIHHGLDSLLASVNANLLQNNIYFCPQVFDSLRRTKENVKVCTCAWADLDTCHPSKLLVSPTFTLESSPGRYQAFWVFNEPQDPNDAEELSRRIAYYHESEGADKSGWDLTQLLRMPFTYNHKYEKSGSLPVVRITQAEPVRYDLSDFDVYPKLTETTTSDFPFPEELPELSAEDILRRHRTRVHDGAIRLYDSVPTDDWSKALWQLQLALFEAGMSREEVFIVARDAKCNKYARDNRPLSSLWKEVVRAWFKFEEAQNGWSKLEKPADIISPEEVSRASEDTTIIEEYVEWAKTVGDAAWQYHEAGAFVTLSSLLAGRVTLPTSFGRLLPNLWFMILADTTLTRKTTAMDLAMDMVVEIDADAMMATDGSIEGLFTAMSTRPGRPSVFLRDEFSGLLEAMSKKDYMAGMMETLTKLYDGKYQKRILKRDIIEVRDPVLIFFAGGIKSRIQAQLTYEHVGSGFLPRFLFIAAESDTTKLRPLGPPTDKSMGRRGYVLSKFQNIFSHYTANQRINVGGRVVETPKRWEAELTPAAWERYNKFETAMIDHGLSSHLSDVMVPTMDRMSKSGLKMATLLAACRLPEDKIVVQEGDIIKAFSYIDRWRPYTLEILSNIGMSAAERTLDNVYNYIKRKPGTLKSHVMRTYHLGAKEMENILMTLDQRHMISRSKSGRTEQLFPIGKGAL